jgi:uracil-DNA glycosylase
MNPARAARILAQHAETSRLMGADFLPISSPPPREAAPVGEPLVEPKPPPATQPGGTAPFTPAPPDAGTPAPRGPRDRAQAQRELDEIRARYEADAPHRHFVTAHTCIVFGEGDPCARLMFIGEAPGQEEDRTGRPFVGRAGQLLDKMITAMGLKREEVYIANILKTRPPNNATPTLEEARLCAPYLFEQIRAICPEVIVTLGLPATRLILESSESMGRLRGTWGVYRGIDGREIPVMPTFHPAYLLRNYTPDARHKVWSDLQKVMDRLGLRSPSGPA